MCNFRQEILRIYTFFIGKFKNLIDYSYWFMIFWKFYKYGRYNQKYNPMMDLSKFTSNKNILTKFSYKIGCSQPKITTLLNFFLLEVNFDKSTIGLPFFSYIIYTCKISNKLKIDSYVINKLFKLQVIIV